MKIDTVAAWQVDVGDFLIIHDEECTVTGVDDEGDIIVIQFRDAFGTLDDVEALPEETFDIWGN